jgi:hypothetical protein
MRESSARPLPVSGGWIDSRRIWTRRGRCLIWGSSRNTGLFGAAILHHSLFGRDQRQLGFRIDAARATLVLSWSPGNRLSSVPAPLPVALQPGSDRGSAEGFPLPRRVLQSWLESLVRGSSTSGRPFGSISRPFSPLPFSEAPSKTCCDERAYSALRGLPKPQGSRLLKLGSCSLQIHPQHDRLVAIVAPAAEDVQPPDVPGVLLAPDFHLTE